MRSLVKFTTAIHCTKKKCEELSGDYILLGGPTANKEAEADYIDEEWDKDRWVVDCGYSFVIRVLFALLVFNDWRLSKWPAH